MVITAAAMALPLSAEEAARTDLLHEMEATLQALEQESPHRFLTEALVPRESRYFVPGIGVHPILGMPFDHVRIRRHNEKIAEVGAYTAPSKLSLYIPVLVKVISGDPRMAQSAVKPLQARRLLKQSLSALQRFSRDFPQYKGFFPWMEFRRDGRLVPSGNQLPSLDNGQLSWALAALIGALQESASQEDQELVAAARDILRHQDYGRFRSRESGRLMGLVEVRRNGAWSPHESYELMDMFEGSMAVLWAVVNGQVPASVWRDLEIIPVEYETEQGEKLTTLRGFRGSFHEHWGLLFLPYMESDLAPLYRNYLYVQADYARRNNVPGFLATANDSRGAYTQMGVPALAQTPGDRADVGVIYATAMGLMIDPVGAERWLRYQYEIPGVLTRFGAVEAVAADGFADIMTADAKGITLLAAAGGVVPEINRYLRSRAAREGVSHYDVLIALLNDKYAQFKEKRGDRAVAEPSNGLAAPPAERPEIKDAPPVDPGERFGLSEVLSPGHRHGKNVVSVGREMLADDMKPGGLLGFDFSIGEDLAPEDQWAYRGTYLSRHVGIAGMRYFSVEVPKNTPPLMLSIELKRDNVLLAQVWLDTSRKGIAVDEQWKRLTLPVQPAPDAAVMPLDYISVVVWNPEGLRGRHVGHGRQGRVLLRGMELRRSLLPEEAQRYGRRTDAEAPGQIDVMRYWVPSQGDLGVDQDPFARVLRLDAGPGWRGGALPYLDLSKAARMHVRARNTSGGGNTLRFSFQRDGEPVFGGPIAVTLPKDSEWRVITVPLKDPPQHLVNYLAITDPQGPCELGSISFSSN